MTNIPPAEESLSEIVPVPDVPCEEPFAETESSLKSEDLKIKKKKKKRGFFQKRKSLSKVLSDPKKMTDRETEIGVPVIVNMFLDYCCSCFGGSLVVLVILVVLSLSVFEPLCLLTSCVLPVSHVCWVFSPFVFLT